MAKDAPAAFFSYCREDSDFALRLAEDLKAAGAGVWLDQLDILPGQRWDHAVEEALTSCSRMLVILSPASVNSTNVMDEVAFALEEKKVVIPVVYKDCSIPFRLRRVQYLDFRRDYARGLKELLKTLAPDQTDFADAAERQREIQQAARAEEQRHQVEQAPQIEQVRRAIVAEHRRQLEKDDRKKTVLWGRLPVWARIGIPSGVILAIAIALYWALSQQHSGPPIGEAQKQQQKPQEGSWKKQISGTVEALRSVAFATSRVSWAVGWNGTILHTVDGGVTWKKQSSGTYELLTSVAFATPQVGWAVGGKGTILHTVDGGVIWTKQSSGTSEELDSVAFATPQVGWAVGYNGTILHTVDGGATWVKQRSGTEWLGCVAFATPQVGWAVGWNGTILHTVDGGATWEKQTSGTGEWLLSVAFATSRESWAVGYNGTILHRALESDSQP